MAKHNIITGEFQTGVRLLHERGGQLMPVRTEQHPAIHLCGQQVTTIWPPNSRVRGAVMEISKTVGYDPLLATTGRIVRHITNDILSVPYGEVEPDRKLAALARKGAHWHYLYAKPGLYDYAIEIDVKSAYWASFMTGKSLLYGPGMAPVSDGGLLQDFDAILGVLPKNLRLAAVGGFASWRNQYWVPDRAKKDEYGLILKSREHIKYGGLFNASHRAILRTWKFMEAVHKLLGDNTLRIHTDGVIIDCSNGMEWEQSLEDLFRKWRYDYSIKGFGHCWIHDVNSGILGTKIMGGKKIIMEEAKKAGIKINPRRPAPCSHRWFEELPATIGAEINMNPARVYSQSSLDLGID